MFLPSPLVFLGAVLLGLACFLLRFGYRAHLPFYGIDTYWHLAVGRRIREAKYRIPSGSGLYSIEGKMDYPPLFLYFLALFPERWDRRLAHFLSPILDGLFASLLTVAIYLLSGSLLGSLVGTSVFVLSPLLWREATYLSVRSFATFVFGLTFLVLIASGGKFDFLSGIAVILCFAAVLLTHRMTTQALLLLVAIYILYTREWQALLLLALAYAVALLVARQYFLKVVAGHIHHLRYFRKYAAPRLSPGFMTSSRARGRVFLTMVLPSHWTFLGALWFLLEYPLGLTPSLEALLCLAFAVHLILIQTKTFGFLADDRIAGYGIFPAALLFGRLVTGVPGLATLLWGIGLGVGVLGILLAWRSNVQKDREGQNPFYVSPRLLDVSAFLTKRSERSVLASAPYRNVQIAYFSGKRTGLVDTVLYEEEARDLFGHTKLTTEDLGRKYGFDLLVYERREFEEKARPNLELLYENEEFSVFRLRGPTSNTA